MGSDRENYDPSFPDQPVVDLYLPIWSNLPAFQSKPVFIWVEDGSDSASRTMALTYGQLDDSVDRVSTRLRTHLQRGDCLVILCPPGLELIEMIFGCQRAGLLIIPILPPDPSFSQESHIHHLVRILSQTKPKAAIATEHYITMVKDYISGPSPSARDKKLVELLKNLEWMSTDELKRRGDDAKLASYDGIKPEEVYLIQYTSGATGIPKPVLVTAGSAAHNVRMARKAYDLHPNSVIVSWLPQYHDCGLMFLLLTIVSGATCVLTSPNAFLKRPRLWLEMISEFRATCTPVPSFTLPLVVRRSGVDRRNSPISLWSMKNLIIINEPIYREPVEEFVRVFRACGLEPSAISPSYGLAENCTFVSTAWRPPSASSDTGNFPRVPTYNELLPSARLDGDGDDVDMNIVVVDEETSSPVSDGIEGEIWVSSPSNASGYLGHPSLTREIFHSRLSGRASHRFLRTGDRGVIIGEHRYLFITGRCADIIRRDGSNTVHPHYIETAAYNSYPGVLRGGCIAAFERWRGSVAVAAELQRQESPEVMRRVCMGVRKAVLEDVGVEVGTMVLVAIGSVPKTTSGKLRRWAARERLRKGEMAVAMAMEFDDNNEVMTNEEEREGGVAYSRLAAGSPRHRLVSSL